MARNGRCNVKRIRTAVLVGLALAGAAAPVRAGERWIGTWNAPLLWRCVEIAGPLDVSAELRVGTGRERLPLPGATLRRTADSVDVAIDWDGTRIQMSGNVRGEEAGGVLLVRRGEVTLTEGVWTLRRYRDASLSAGELLERMRAAVGAAPGGTADGVHIAQDPVRDEGASVEPKSETEPAAWSVSITPDGRLATWEEGQPAVVFDGDRVHAARAPFGFLPPDGRLSDKLFLAEVIRSGAPLFARTPLDLSVAEHGAGSERRLVLTLLTARGVAPARFLVDPATYLPERAEAEWDAGSWTVFFRDWTESDGLNWAARCTTSYRGRDRAWRTIRVEPHAFGVEPPAPREAAYDRDANPELTGIRGEGEGGHLFVRPLIDGSDAGWFHIDTGAPFVILDAGVADALDLPVLREMGPRSIRRIGELRLGQLILRNCVVLVQDLSDMSAPAGERRAGVIGGTAFERAVVEFDYGENRLAVWAPDAFAETDLPWQPMSVESAPVVEAQFAGGTDRFFLDTGKSGTVSFSSQGALAHGLPGRRATTEEANATVVGETIELSTTIDWFELGGKTFRGPEVRIKVPGTPNDDVTGTAGWIGRGFFGARRVVFDYGGGRIAFAATGH